MLPCVVKYIFLLTHTIKSRAILCRIIIEWRWPEDNNLTVLVVLLFTKYCFAEISATVRLDISNFSEKIKNLHYWS